MRAARVSVHSRPFPRHRTSDQGVLLCLPNPPGRRRAPAEAPYVYCLACDHSWLGVGPRFPRSWADVLLGTHSGAHSTATVTPKLHATPVVAVQEDWLLVCVGVPRSRENPTPSLRSPANTARRGGAPVGAPFTVFSRAGGRVANDPVAVLVSQQLSSALGVWCGNANRRCEKRG